MLRGALRSVPVTPRAVPDRHSNPLPEGPGPTAASASVGRGGAWPARVALAGVLALVGARVGGPTGAGLTLLGTFSVPALRRRLRRRRATRHYDDELVRFLRAVARSLRSGATLRVAVLEAGSHTAGPLAHDVSRLSLELDDGVVRALERWAARRALPSVRLVAGGLALGHVTGGITARIVDSLADSIRVRLDGRDEAVALSSQATASALVMSGVPLAFLGLGVIGDGASARFLLHHPLGRVCLVVGLLLDAAAMVWMLRMIRSVER